MGGSQETIIAVIRRKGVVEFVVLGMSIAWRRLASLFRIIWLRSRGYAIAFSVELSGSNMFFQGTRGSISIGEQSRLGRGTRMDTGFGGRISVGSGTLIDDYGFITAQSSIEIGDNVLIAAGCFVTDFNHAFSDARVPIRDQGYVRKPVKIGDDVWIGAHCVILPGVTIGNGAVIGAGSVVTHSVKPHTVVAGNPAVLIRSRS